MATEEESRGRVFDTDPSFVKRRVKEFRMKP